MNFYVIFCFLLSFLFASCQTENNTLQKEKYLRYVGDIKYDNLLDNEDFTLCHEEEKAYQYFNFGKGPLYTGEKLRILQTFETQYQPIDKEEESGWIRIRFLVNCQGKAGRFRMIQSDFDYQEKEFDERIVTQLLAITKNIQYWQGFEPVDYYMYLIFKMKDSKIIEILP